MLASLGHDPLLTVVCLLVMNTFATQFGEWGAWVLCVRVSVAHAIYEGGVVLRSLCCTLSTQTAAVASGAVTKAVDGCCLGHPGLESDPEVQHIHDVEGRVVCSKQSLSSRCHVKRAAPCKSIV
jgi:hypothetical protein